MAQMAKRLLVLAAASLFSIGTALAEACSVEAGPEAAQVEVDRCLEVSPATRPPCNADNPCQMIRDEIARGCAMLGSDKPDYCYEYEG